MVKVLDISSGSEIDNPQICPLRSSRQKAPLVSGMSSQLPNPLKGANQTQIKVLRNKLFGTCFELFRDDAICPQIK